MSRAESLGTSAQGQELPGYNQHEEAPNRKFEVAAPLLGTPIDLSTLLNPKVLCLGSSHPEKAASLAGLADKKR